MELEKISSGAIDDLGQELFIGDIVEFVHNIGNFGVPHRPHMHLAHGQIVLIKEKYRQEFKIEVDFRKKSYDLDRGYLHKIGTMEENPELLKQSPRSYTQYIAEKYPKTV